jgi:hypothetical protein
MSYIELKRADINHSFKVYKLDVDFANNLSWNSEVNEIQNPHSEYVELKDIKLIKTYPLTKFFTKFDGRIQAYLVAKFPFLANFIHDNEILIKAIKQSSSVILELSDQLKHHIFFIKYKTDEHWKLALDINKPLDSYIFDNVPNHIQKSVIEEIFKSKDETIISRNFEFIKSTQSRYKALPYLNFIPSGLNQFAINFLKNKFAMKPFIEMGFDKCVTVEQVKKNSAFIKYLDDQNDVVSHYAIEDNPFNVIFLKNPTDAMFVKAVSLCPEVIFTIKDIENKKLPAELVMILLKIVLTSKPELMANFDKKLLLTLNGLYLKDIDDQTDEDCMIAVRQNGLALEYVKNRTTEIKLAAILQNSAATEILLAKK